jgi:hypothetical protein
MKVILTLLLLTSGCTTVSIVQPEMHRTIGKPNINQGKPLIIHKPIIIKPTIIKPNIKNGFKNK